MTRRLGKYLLQEKIYESDHSEIYRSLREADHHPCILKILKQDHPNAQELIRYKQEHKIIRDLDLDGVIKTYGIETDCTTLAIVLEDFGGTSLQGVMQDTALFSESASENLLQFLTLAIAITDALGQLHAAQIIHKDINPSNIIIHPQTRQVKLIDFGSAAMLTQESIAPKSFHTIEGTLPYIAPEQTGRMNRVIDFRTDFYSLGATLYEILTGHVPFSTTNIRETVHAHIAKQPLSPADALEKQNREKQSPINLPQTVSQIVMKLLAKDPEERYQSAWSLKSDLEECYRQLENTGSINPFPLGTRDTLIKFQIPQKLYGREQEIEDLLAAFDRIAGSETGSKSEMMLITGHPGIGKSSLVQVIHQLVTASQGYFVSGKFDQFQRTIPYSALVSALQGLMHQLLSASDKQLGHWREQLLTVLQPNAQIIIDVIPELELIIGKQPACETLGALETQNRFHRAFRQFIQVFCQPEKPLVIFLDDLHWIDSATLKLIEIMMTAHKLQNLFLIGAYRSNEVSATHPVSMMLARLEQQNATINHIALNPLPVKWINQLLSDTLRRGLDSTLPLAKLVAQKTGGNPFFVNQFIQALYRKHLITFNAQKAWWQWDAVQVESSDMPERVVDLMIETINTLSFDTQEQLRLASCIGSDFDIKTLSIVSEQPSSEIFKWLLPAVDAGLIRPELESDSGLLSQGYQFCHDRIQQAAHMAIELPTLKATHLKIGRLLRANLSDAEKSERMFEVVDHFNIGQALITSAQERLELARLNLETGQKAKEATAYAAALQYLTVGVQLLSQDSWEHTYALAFSLHIALAEVCYLEGELQRAKELIAVLLEKQQSVVDQSAAYSLLILLCTLQADYAEALAVGRTALQRLGLEIPVSNLSAHISHELSEAKNYWQTCAIADLAHQPETKAPEQVSTIQLLMQLIVPAYLTDEDLFTFLATKSANFSFRYGPTPESVLGYSCYGTVLSRSGDYQSGYEFALMSLALTKRFGDLKNRAKACNLLADHAAHWVKPLASIKALHDEGYEAALISGDLQFGGYLLHAKIFCAFAMGQNLEEVLAESATYLVFAQETQNVLSINTLLTYRFAILNLLGRTKDALSFHDDDIDESVLLERLYTHSDYFSSCFFHILRVQTTYLYGDFSMALDCARLAEQFLPAIRNFFQEAELNLYKSLSLVAAYEQASLEEQKHYRAQLEGNLAQLKVWSDHCPENFLHKYLLVKAELAKLDNHGMDALALYDRAIAAAKESQFIQAEALGNELAARFWLEHDKHEFARLHLKRARDAYQRWGATRKVTQLETTYTQWLDPRLETPFVERTRDLSTTVMVVDSGAENSGKILASLDLQSVLSASQVLSEAIVLEELLAKLMNLAIENAGAQRGFLLLEKEGQWVIEASGSIDQQEVQVLQSYPLESAQSTQLALLSREVVYDVARSLENLVLANAVDTEKYRQDPYILKHQVKSLLCIPLLLQGDLSGILYLENNLLEGVFTDDRIEVLKLLSSQAAISLRNSRLYVALQDSQKDLAQSNQTLATKNTALEKARSDLAHYSQNLEERVAQRTAELTRTNEKLQQQVVERQVAEQKLCLANQELEKLATIDGLTQISNRRSFDQWFQQEWKQLGREQHPLSLIIFDVDYFKNYNDHYSHQAGDDCLVAIAQAAKAAINRPSDLISRYGGEEFAVILPKTDQVGAVAIAERIQTAIRELGIPHARSQVSAQVSVSLGIATVVPTGDTSPTELIAQADQALYAAKGQGRDRYHIHG